MTDFERKSGTTIEIETTVTKLVNGVSTPVDLTGLLGAYFTAKNSPLDADDAAVFTGSLVDGRCAVIDAANGKIRTKIPDTATSGFTRTRRLHWNLKIRESDNDVWSPDGGLLLIELDTRRVIP